MEVDRRSRLDLNKKMIRSGLDKIFQITLRLDDHQMHVQRLRGGAAHRVHDGRAEGDVGHEPAVHDVDVDPIGAGLIDSADFVSEPPQVGGQNGRRDDDRFHDALRDAAPARGKMNRSIALAKPSSL